MRSRLLAFGLLLPLLASELACRALWGFDLRPEREAYLAGEGRREGFESGRFESSLRLHPYFGYVSRRGNRFGLLTESEIGLCGDRLCWKDRAAGEIVVGIFGGSLALQLGSRSAELRAALERRLPGRRIRVVSFAQPGHAAPQPFQIYSYFRDLVQVALLVDGYNELWNPLDNNRFGVPPVYAKAVHYRLLERDGEAAKLRELISGERARLKRATERSLAPLWSRSALAHLLWRAERARSESALARLGSGALLEPGQDFFRNPREELLALALREWEFSHEQFRGLARRAGALFLHALQPSLLAGAKPLAAGEKRALGEAPAIATELRTGYRKLRARARALGALDLCSVFDGNSAEIWLDPVHVSDTGIAILHERIADALAPRLGRGRR